jgi:ABC-type multidrug transport system ATPase subunit
MVISAFARQVAAAIEEPAISQPQLVLEGIMRSFGTTVALAPIGLNLGRGAICEVTGANGSGKSTLLRVAAGVIRPSGGRRWAAGPALYLQPGDGARRAQTVRQAVEFVASTRGNVTTVREALTTVGLRELADTPVRQLSSGQRARVTLAIALAFRPSVACFDEPTAHLDGEGCMAAKAVVYRLAGQGSAVLVATHDKEFLGGLADRRIRLSRGRLESTR